MKRQTGDEQIDSYTCFNGLNLEDELYMYKRQITFILIHPWFYLCFHEQINDTLWQGRKDSKELTLNSVESSYFDGRSS